MVLEGTNNYNYIYFGANITLTAGIKIASTKTNITIDGTYQNVRYTYEDMKNLSASNTISPSYLIYITKKYSYSNICKL